MSEFVNSLEKETKASEGHRGRLRERFARGGLAAFADYELLELLLTFAIPRRDLKPIAKRLIESFGSVKGVLDAPPGDLAALKGIGKTTALFFPLLRATMRRYYEHDARETDLLNSPAAVINYCRSWLEGLKNEVFDVVYLSTKNRVLGRERLAEGTIDQTAVYPRRVVAGALAANAAGLIFVHNHPSGDPTPSPDDKRLTRQLVEAARTVEVSVLDHIVIGNGRHVSFRDQGLL